MAGYSQEEWTPLLTHEKMDGHRDAQSHALSKSNQNNCKQNSPRIVVSWTVPLFRTSHGVCLLVVGEHKLYHSVWELPIMYVAWKIPRSLSCYVDNESIPLKILFNLYFKTRALAPLQISASLSEGPIYLLLLLSHHPLIKSTS